MGEIVTASAAWMAQDVLADVFEPPPMIDYLAWAEDNIVFTKRESQFPGPYNRERFSYFDAILGALSPEDPCRTVTMSKSAQLGGTVLANIFTGGSLEMDPGDFLYVHPTDENARRWSKMKLAPMLKGTDALRRIFPMRARDGLDSLLYKERLDGQGAIQISGANSPAGLSQVSMARQVQDDLAKWDMNPAGDPETQADSRSQGYEFAKIFKISTPMVVPGCRITTNFEAGSQEYLHVPCPHDECGHMQTLEWQNFLAALDEDKPEAAHFTCVSCGASIEEHHRPKMLRGGQWIAESPKMMRVHRSFYLWSAYSQLQSFERIARSWLAARGDPPKEQTFMNDVVGKAYRILGEAPPWEALRDRASESEYARGTIPAGFPLVTCGADCQGDRVEWQVIAWGPNKRRAVVEYGVFDGHISEPKCHAKLNGLLKQGFTNAYGRKVEIDLLAIDGNAYTEDVWEWAKKHPASRAIMVRGGNSDGAPLIKRVKKEYRKGKLARYSRRFYTFNGSVLKMALYRNLRKEDPVATGYILFPRGLEDEYFRQLTAETRKEETNRRTGFKRWLWVKDPSVANEALDTANQAEIAFVRLAGVQRTLPDADWDRLFAERECAEEGVQGDFEDLLFAPVTPAHDPDKMKEPAGSAADVDLRKKWKNRT